MSPVQVKPSQPTAPTTTEKPPIVDRLVVSLDNGVEHVSQHVCQAIIDASVAAISARGAFTIAVGAEGAPFLATLKSVFEERGVNPQFELWHVLLTDARFATNNHPDAVVQALKALELDIPSSQVYGIDEDVLLKDPDSLAASYESTIQSVLAEKSGNMMDMVLLGLNSTGQVASLLPEDSILKEEEKLVGAVKLSGNEQEKNWGITLTLPTLDFMTREVLFCGAGSDKGSLLKNIFKIVDPDETATGQYSNSRGKCFKVTHEDGGCQEFGASAYPCIMVNNPNVTWVVDMEAVKAAKAAADPY